MLPVLLDLGFIKIYTFGVFLVLAFLWSTFLLWKNVRLTSYKEDEVFDGVFLSLFGGLFVGRLVYVVLHFDKFGFDFFKFILINGYPGLSIYGILAGAIITFLLFAHYKKIKVSEIIDYAIPPLFIALGIGKLGSFFAGTEIGAKTTSFLALRYVNFDGARHLTPLYEAILFFIAAFVAHRMLFAIRRERFWKGMTFYFFGWVFSLVYLVFDPLKSSKALILGQSVNWAVSLSLLLTFTLYFLYHLRSQIFNGMKKITSFKPSHAKQINPKVHNPATEQAGGGTSENSPADKEAQS